MATPRTIRLINLPARIADRLRWEWHEWHSPSRPSFQHEELDHAILDLVPWRAGERVLDVGCAQGHYLRKLAERDVHVVGLDLSIDSLRRARCHGRPVLAASGERLPVRDASFDTIFCHKTMYMFGNPADALREFARVLRPAGRLVFSTSATRTPYAFIQRAAIRLLKQSDWRFGNRLAPGEWQRLAEGIGFADTRYYACNLVVPIVFRVCDHWILPNEWMRRYARAVRRMTNCPPSANRPNALAQDYVIVMSKRN